MKLSSRLLWLSTGLVMGIIGTGLALAPFPRTQAASNDRFEDCIMCTGPVGGIPRTLSEAVWLLDYRSGRLLSTVIDRNIGQIIGWADMDVATEFAIAPRQNAHFMMTTGMTALGQAVLYLVETTSGKIGVYSMGASAQGNGFAIFRQVPPQSFRGVAAQAPAPDGADAPKKPNIMPFAGKG